MGLGVIGVNCARSTSDQGGSIGGVNGGWNEGIVVVNVTGVGDSGELVVGVGIVGVVGGAGDNESGDEFDCG